MARLITLVALALLVASIVAAYCGLDWAWMVTVPAFGVLPLSGLAWVMSEPGKRGLRHRTRHSHADVESYRAEALANFEHLRDQNQHSGD